MTFSSALRKSMLFMKSAASRSMCASGKIVSIRSTSSETTTPIIVSAIVCGSFSVRSLM